MLKRMILLALAASLLLSACTIQVVTGSGKVITDKRSVSGFTTVIFAGLGELTLVQGDSEGISIEGEENILAKIRTEVRNGVLTIGFDRDNWQDMINPTRTIKYTLNVKNLTSLELTGAGSASINGLKANNLSVRITGAGGVKVSKLEAALITTQLGGAGGVEISGKANQQEINLSGVGSYNAGSLETQTARITLTGAGSATVWAKDMLDVTITGAGSVGYYGAPRITKTVTGLGVLNSLGPK